MGNEITPAYYRDVMPERVYVAQREWERCRLVERLKRAGVTVANKAFFNLTIERVAHWAVGPARNEESPLEKWMRTGQEPAMLFRSVAVTEERRMEMSRELRVWWEAALADPAKLRAAMAEAWPIMEVIEERKMNWRRGKRISP